MANVSHFLSLINGVPRTIDLSNASNTLQLNGGLDLYGNLEFNGSTSGQLFLSASAVTSTYSLVWPAAQAASSGYVLTNDGTGVLSWTSPSAGSVTSVGLVLPSSVFNVTVSPITSSGNLTAVLQTQSANTVWAGPASGSAATPTFRALVSADIPNNAANTSGTASNITASSNSTLTTLSSLSLPTSQLTGYIQASNFPALTGDVTTSAGSLSTSLVATSNATLATLSALITASSLSSVGTITSGTWNGSTIAIANGGTGQTSALAAFNALSPMTTAGDILYENSTPSAARLAIGSAGQVLTVSGGLPIWASPATSGTVTSVSVVSANGFAGTVATATSTPAITIETTLNTPVLAGNGTALIAATTTGTGSTVVLSASPTFTGTVNMAALVASSTGSFGGAVNMNSNQINDLADGTASSDAVNLGQLQAAINGLTWKGPVQVLADSNQALTGGATLTIDGYAVQNGNYVMLTNQTVPSQNGIYQASGIGSAYTLTLISSGPEASTALGDAYLVLNGTVYGNTAYQVNGLSPTTFIQFAGPNTYSFSAPLDLTGNVVSITQANTSTNGYLSSTDWNTFNNKQPAGSYITALTGDGTASGPGSAAFTLATVNGNVGSFGSSTSIPSFTVNAKGLITAASGNAVVAPAGTLSGTTLNSTVVSSSLTSVGTITSGTWNGTTIAIANGGTGQTSASAAFNALAPATSTGGLIYGSATNTYSNLGIGSTGQVLTVSGGLPVWSTPVIAPSEITLTDNHILVGNASNVAADVAMSGDVAIVASGATTIQPGVVTLSKLASNSVDENKIVSSAFSSTGALSGGSGTKISVNVDGATIEINGSDQLQVLSAPLNSQMFIAGQTFAANTSYAVRMMIPTDSGYVAGYVVAADQNTAVHDLFWVIGIAFSAAGVSAGSPIPVVSLGSYPLGSGDTAFASGDVGKPVYLNAAGAFSTAIPTTSGYADFKVGIVETTSSMFVNGQMMGVA